MDAGCFDFELDCTLLEACPLKFKLRSTVVMAIERFSMCRLMVIEHFAMLWG